MSESEDDQKPGSAGGVNLSPRSMVAIGIAVASLIFVFSNTSEETLRFLWLELSAPGWVLLLALFAAGFLVGFFISRNRYKNRH